jgi:uncharacterized protein
VTRSSRIDALDILRGIAMCGILFANVHVFSGYLLADESALHTLDRWGTDEAVHALERVFLDGKFYSVFSFLFGLGMSVQLRAAAAKGVAFAPLFRRRLTILAGIGLAHATLLWAGDILLLYALLGFILLALRDVSDRGLRRWIGGLLAAPIVWYALLWAAGAPDLLAGPPPDPNAPPGPDLFQWMLNNMQSASYLDWLKGNALWLAGRWIDLIQTARFPKVLGMFVLGLYVDRAGILRDPAAHRVLIDRALAWGLGVGLPLNIAAAWLAPGQPLYPANAMGAVQIVALAIGTPLLAVGYVALVVRALDTAVGRSLLGPFRAVGKTALSNYLTQSAVAAFLFFGYGLGWFGTVGLTEGMLIAACIVSVLIVVSNLWVRVFAYGPVEWIWRQLTYKQRIPLRR